MVRYKDDSPDLSRSPEQRRQLRCQILNQTKTELFENENGEIAHLTFPEFRRDEVFAEMEKLGFTVSFQDGEELNREGVKIKYININELDPKPPIAAESLPLHPEPDPSDIAF